MSLTNTDSLAMPPPKEAIMSAIYRTCKTTSAERSCKYCKRRESLCFHRISAAYDKKGEKKEEVPVAFFSVTKRKLKKIKKIPEIHKNC